DLQSADAHDAGKRPSLDRYRPFHCTRRNHQTARLVSRNAVFVSGPDRPVAIDLPDIMAEEQSGAARLQGRDKPCAMEIVVAENGPHRRTIEIALHSPVDLASGLVLQVEQ